MTSCARAGAVAALVLLPWWAAADEAPAPQRLACDLLARKAQGLTLDVTCRATGVDGDFRWVMGMEAGNAFVTGRRETRENGVATVSYALDVDAMARKHNFADVAQRAGAAWVVNDNNLLLRPSTLEEDAQVVVSVRGVAVGTPWLPSGPSTWQLTGEQLDGGAYLLLGPQREVPVDVPGSVVMASVPEGDEFTTALPTLGRWVTRSARMVTDFNGGKMPVPRTHVVLLPVKDNAEGGLFGTTLRWGQGSIVLLFGATSPAAEFDEDWVAPHELFHLTNPHLRKRLPWVTEGFTTYYGDVIRVRAGARPPAQGWKNILRGFSQACDTWHLRGVLEDSQSMRVMHSYQRVYWGGACAAFITDVGLRESSNNKRTLDLVYKDLRARSLGEDGPVSEDDVVAALVESLPPGHWARAWVDAALHGRKTLRMDDIYQRLGVVRRGEGMTFDEKAPWAHVRRGIMGEDPGPAPTGKVAAPGPPTD